MNSDGDAELCSLLLFSAPKALKTLTDKLDKCLELVPATSEAIW